MRLIASAGTVLITPRNPTHLDTDRTNMIHKDTYRFNYTRWSFRMPHNTIAQLTTAQSTDDKAGKARIKTIIDDAPLFAGLDDYILKQTERMEADTAKAVRVKKQKETVTRQTKKVTSDRVMSENTAKVQKTVSVTDNSMLLSVTETCALLKISRATLVRMDKSGQLPGRLKMGGSVRFHRETVESWLRSLITTRPAPP